ncbi:MAG: sodium/glutamate symporter [Phycisphaeraceae bacterium]
MSLFVIALLAVCAMLAVGFALRVGLRPLQALFIPASVVGGLVGFAAIQAGLRIDATAEASQTLAAMLRGWPGLLIAVVFSGLLLERSGKRISEAAGRAARQGVMVWIIVLGQVFLGLLATWLFVLPFHDVPASFGQLIETGFAGGHGTAAAMGAIFTDQLDFPEGQDLAYFFATFGLIYGVISGIVMVNIGIRRGWTRSRHARLTVIQGMENAREPTPAAYARVRSEVIDPLVFQALILAGAFALGWGLQTLFTIVAGRVLSAEAMQFVSNIPLFLFTLLGGWCMRELLHAAKLGHLIDPTSIRRLVATAMEVLIVAGIASLRIETLQAYLLPTALLLAIGSVWGAVCLLVFAPRLLPAGYWFELGLINYGMSFATTAQGLMLLRVVDPDLDSGAAEDYAAAAPLSAPFIGGGVLTVLVFPQTLTWMNPASVVLVCGLALLVLLALGWLMSQREAPAVAAAE